MGGFPPRTGCRLVPAARDPIFEANISRFSPVLYPDALGMTGGDSADSAFRLEDKRMKKSWIVFMQ
jgi:hypothetical protein